MAPRIVGERSAAKEAEFVICITDDRDELALHTDMFHLADERLDSGLLGTGDLLIAGPKIGSEERAARLLRQQNVRILGIA